MIGNFTSNYQQEPSYRVSLSGIQDWVLTSFGAPVVTGWDDTPIYNQELINEVDRLYQAVKEADAQYQQRCIATHQ